LLKEIYGQIEQPSKLSTENNRK